jgi:hypothetical protein
MLLDVARIRSAFDALPIESDVAFQRLIGEGKLRYAGTDGGPDLVDELSARLVCSALRTSVGAELVVFPDGLGRRSPLLFAVALVMDAVSHMGDSGFRRTVLYLSNHAGIRTQLARVRVGALSLDGVFTQQHGSGRAQELRTVSLPGGARLPVVVSVCAPADPLTLLREHRPSWVAVDCGDASELEWLPALLREARRLGIPVVGWTARPFSDVAAQWLRPGGGVLRWPFRREAGGQRIGTLEQLWAEAIAAEVTPRILAGDHVHEISLALAAATEALLAATELRQGRLSSDATALGWRYLRAIESLSVPVEVYEREATSYWGVRRLADLRAAFERFVKAVETVSPRLHGTLLQALEALSSALNAIGGVEPPLWLGLANLCIESRGCRRIVFSSKSRREMFSLCLLARFNISEDDLRDVGVKLDYLGGDHSDGAPEAEECADRGIGIPVFVGLPSRFAERRLDALLHSGSIEVVLWPHQERVFAHRVRALSAELAFSSRGLRGLLPQLEEQSAPGGLRKGDGSRSLRIAMARGLVAGTIHDELSRRAAVLDLWKRPYAAEAITSLFGTLAIGEEDEGGSGSPVLDDAPQAVDSSQSTEAAWVSEAYELCFDGNRRLLLARDDTVNVIVRKQGGAELEERYVRAIRPGDEILFIHGQARQSLYGLLVSRVHRDPVIAQYLALIRRWQDDLVRSFAEAERQSGLNVDRLLAELQKRGSTLTSPQTIRSWLRRLVLAPNDVEDLQRVADVLSIGFVTTYFRQIHKAARRLKGLHINLSARLNRWLASSDAGSVAVGDVDDVVDSELGLTVGDFRHSLVRLRVVSVTQQHGPFYRPHMGRLEGGSA